MKDNAISYDLTHHPQHQQHSWNHSRQHQHQQQQSHPSNTYANQHNSQQQSRSMGSHQQQQQQHQSQQDQQHGLGHYSHQQLQSATHHNNNPVASAYYQQAHLYPSFQDQQQQQQQQQQAGAEHQHHHLTPGPPVSSGSSSSALNAAAVAAAQQQHAVHNQQATNAHAPSLNHTGWSPNVGALTGQTHHAVVTDHSTLAYMTHAYQSHNSSVNDHHRSSTGPLANQPIGTGPQGSSYAVDSLYNSSAAAAAAVAAYGYNNYNAAFFQTSNNAPHTQTGHPSQAGLSAFWNHNQGGQQRSAAHSQTVTGQASLQQRQQQQLASDQASNYMHDPRLYYGRPPYGQVMQNFSQHQTQPTQQQTDIHNRLSTLSQQQSLVQPDHQLSHFDTLSSQQLQHPLLAGHHQTGSNSGAQLNSLQQNSAENTSSQNVSLPQVSTARKLHSPNGPSQQQMQKQIPTDSDKSNQPAKSKNEFDQTASGKNLHSASSNQVSSQKVPIKDSDSSASSLAKQPPVLKDQQGPVGSLTSTQKPQSVIKNEPVGPYQARKQNNNGSNQAQGRNAYRAPQDDRTKSQNAEATRKSSNERDVRPTLTSDVKNQPAANKQIDSGIANSLEESLATLTIASRKTTWASIASQPAKVAQPKSLKSKIAGSNSVLSSAKHLASSVTLDPAPSLESKNGINPAIKSSVSTVATSLQRSSVPPPIAKVSAAAAALKLDLLGEDDTESSKISWPAVNASVNLTLDDPPLQKSTLSSSYQADKLKNDDDSRRDSRDALYRDHNHNRGANNKMVNNYQSHNEDRRDDHWGPRRDQRDQRDHRVRRDSDRKEMDHDKRLHDDSRNNSNQRRDFRAGGRVNHFRADDGESPYRDHKRGGAIMDRNEYRGNDNYNRFPSNRYEPTREQVNHLSSNNARNNETAPHHHYNNLRDGNSTRATQGKLDISLHPHLNPANYNPKSFNCEPPNARYFIIKSYSEDDIHRSIKYSIWCSTNHGNKRLDEAYRQQQAVDGDLYLFFSVNGSGHFCGMAQMTSAVDFDSSSGVWAQSKWQGSFNVKWIYVKDVPNSALRHITLENNEDKPVTNSRDTQEVPSEKGKSVLAIIHQYTHTTSLFDDFLHYERRQEEEKLKKSQSEQHHGAGGRADDRGPGGSRYNRPYANSRNHNDFRDHSNNRDRPSRYAH